jgi:hypothetical protein
VYDVSVYAKGDTRWVVARPVVPQPGPEAGPIRPFVWKLSIGVASISGLAYWALALSLAVAAHLRLRG